MVEVIRQVAPRTQIKQIGKQVIEVRTRGRRGCQRRRPEGQKSPDGRGGTHRAIPPTRAYPTGPLVTPPTGRNSGYRAHLLCATQGEAVAATDHANASGTSITR
ncbi:hypothetical protein MNVM_13950 [Mycobacterium novum]|uniref:Uncharacterized protein n=2 Tax=Mycobacteriaceae TaxID=1762 RepID=A0A7I9YG96_MYCAL|nr:hypothetical protein MNVM_13950 [Mycobacterium novum]GFG87716.1 hypothetical protein MALGJ_43920 [Mycolicibacter algericus]